MELKCPACKKINEPASPCTRCGCELEGLARIARAAEQEISRSIACLHAENYFHALTHAERSWGLIRSTKAAQCVFFACLGLERYDEAEKWRHRGSGATTSY